MDKVLTISIAAYNVERYIRQTLDSLIDEEVIGDLEIFVVDDGGTDNTLKIAREYAEKYPRSIFPIHKENGGYGSTVNYSIAHATGKYFKILDGDDWFVRENLGEFVRQLKSLESDVVITPRYNCAEGGGRVKVNNRAKGCAVNTTLNIRNLKFGRVYGMWDIAYKTEILKKCALELPLHCLYTDQIFSTIPFSAARTICFMDTAIYCYRVGRDGQSVSKESRIKHLDDNRKVTDILCRFCQEQEAAGNENSQYILRRVSASALNIIKTYLLLPVSKDVLQSIRQYDTELKINSPKVYQEIGGLFMFRKLSLYLRVLRLLNYGNAALLISKIVLPKDGLPSWA